MSKDLCDTMICSVNFDLYSFHTVNFDLFLRIPLCSYVYLTVNNVWLIQGSLTSRVNFKPYSKWFSIKWTLPVSINCPCAVRRILNVQNIVWLIQGSLTSRVNFDRLGTHFICEAHSVTSDLYNDIWPVLTSTGSYSFPSCSAVSAFSAAWTWGSHSDTLFFIISLAPCNE